MVGLCADMCLHCRLLHCDSQCRPHLQLLSCGHSTCGEADVSDAWAQLPTGHPRQAWHDVLATGDGGWVHRTSPLRCQLRYIRFRPSSSQGKSFQLLLVHSSGSKSHRTAASTADFDLLIWDTISNLQLYILLYGLSLMHGLQKLTSAPTFWMFFVGPAIIYTFDKVSNAFKAIIMSLPL